LLLSRDVTHSLPFVARRIAAAIILLSLATSCARQPPAAPAADATLRALPEPRHVRSSALPLPAAEVMRLIASEPFTLHDVKRAAAGVMGVSKATAHFPKEHLDLQVKWAPAPPTTVDEWNASPRKELAAFAVQRWFLEPDDWVVPPTTMRCLATTTLPHDHGEPKPTIEGTRCVLGLVAAWLQHVKPTDVVYDADRFVTDRRYAEHLADLNLLTYLIEHRDGRSGNFLVSEDPTEGRTWAVDNGISFGNLVWNYFVMNWDVLRVPALRRTSIERLRRIGPADVDALLVVQELRPNAKGLLVSRTPPGAAIDTSIGARVRDGRVQLGLSRSEADAVGARLKDLLARVDAGEVKTF
jgi:hypothetical protein